MILLIVDRMQIGLYDQIYMYGLDMLKQADIVGHSLDDKNVLFLGDGDGMCMLFISLYANLYEHAKLKGTSVLDFDQRILNNEKMFCDNIDNTANTDRRFVLYNIIDKVPEKLINTFDTFYINPPYGSKNRGVSCIAWLVRALEMCKENCDGYIIIPFEATQKWTVEALQNIEKYLIDKGFFIEELYPHVHRYHLKADYDLTSVSLKVKRTKRIVTGYEGEMLPYELIKQLYGSVRNLPHYIWDDKSVGGKWDYNWKYGDIK